MTGLRKTSLGILALLSLVLLGPIVLHRLQVFAVPALFEQIHGVDVVEATLSNDTGSFISEINLEVRTNDDHDIRLVRFEVGTLLGTNELVVRSVDGLRPACLLNGSSIEQDLNFPGAAGERLEYLGISDVTTLLARTAELASELAKWPNSQPDNLWDRARGGEKLCWTTGTLPAGVE